MPPSPARSTCAEAGGDLASVEHFALCDYLVGLAGIEGQPPPGDPFIAKVAGMIGLREEIVRRWRARVPNYVFAREILRGRGERVSLYDGTIARPAPADERDGSDPLLQPIAAAFGAAFNAYAADDLGYRTDQPYRVLAGKSRGNGTGTASVARAAAVCR